MPVLDASVYITLVNAHEKDHARSWAWFERTQAAGEPIVAPVILLAEVAAALSRGLGDLELAHQVVGQLKHSAIVELLPVTRVMAERAASIAAGHWIRGCDAVYVALADQLDDCLVTLDHQQLERSGPAVNAQQA